MRWIFVFCFIGFFQILFGQEIGKIYTIKLKDGSVINAQIVEINKDIWIVSNEILGNLSIERTKIDSIIDENDKEIIISREKPTRATIINPAPERYFYLPSAFNLPKGKANYQNILIFISGYNYGVTDRLSIGVTLPTLVFIPLPAGTFHVKYSFPLSEETHLGFQMDMGGYIFPSFFGPNNFEFGVGVLPQAVISFGDRKINTSLHLGRGLAVDNFEDTTLNLFGISHITPVTGRMFFVTQNMVLFNNSELIAVPSIGLKILGKRKRGCLDIGLIGSVDVNFADFNEVFLFIGFQRSFGKRRL